MPTAVSAKPWPSAANAIAAAEAIFERSDDDFTAAERLRAVRELVISASMQFIAENRREEAFKLLSVVQLPLDAMDAELFHLHSLLRIYEQKRVSRVRRILLKFLVGVLIYLLAVSPSVFIALENPYRTTHGMSRLDWSEGLYWSVLTSTTVGYGDIVPQTPYARMFALFDALLGVTLMGVVAGLILGQVTLRRFD